MMIAWQLAAVLCAAQPGLAQDDVIDNGKVLPGETVSGTFVVPNRSGIPWTVSEVGVDVDCAGTIAGVVADSVPVDGAFELPLTFQASRTLGVQTASAWATIQQGDEVIPLRFLLSADVCEYLDLPTTVVSVPAGGHELATAFGRYPARWDRFEASAEQDRFTVAVRQVGPGWSLRIDPVVGIHAGTFQAEIRCRFFDGDAELPHQQVLLVGTTLTGPVASTPAMVLIGAVPLGVERRAPAALHWSAGHDRSDLMEVSTSDPRMTCEVDASGMLQMTFRGAEPKGKASGELVLKLRDGTYYHLPYLAAVIGTLTIDP